MKQRADGLENLLRRTEMKIQMPLNVFLMGQPGNDSDQSNNDDEMMKMLNAQ